MDQNPIMQRYQPRDSGSPSWMEENRLNWPREDIQKILSLSPEQFWDPMQHELLEELRVVKECLSSLYSNWTMFQLPIYWGQICYNQLTAVLEEPKTKSGWPGLRRSPSEYLGIAAHGYWVIKRELEMVHGFLLGTPPRFVAMD